MAAANIRNQDENGMNEYERVTLEWNQSNEVERLRVLRSNAINNTPAYQMGYRVHHLRTIQVPFTQLWDELFQHENLNPALRAYSQRSIAFVEDPTNTLLFAGQMEVSLILQENYRPGVHVAIFIVQLTPHRQFHDGHVIQREFGEGSLTHQTINRLFNTDDRAVVSQATEYSILEYLADEYEMLDLLQTCFMDPDFSTVRFSYIPPENNNQEDDEEDNGQYIVDPDALDIHRVHDFNAEAVPAPAAANDHEDGYDDEDDDDDDEWPVPAVVENENERQRPIRIVMAIPPPPPVNDFAAIYQYYYDMYQEDPMYNIINYNDNDDGARERDDELPAQG
jgi:hypothetical protein